MSVSLSKPESAVPSACHAVEAIPTGDVLHVEAGALSTHEEATARPIPMLDGGELIELSIRPSLWFIPILAGRVLLTCALVAGLLWLIAPPSVYPGGALAILATVVVAAARLIQASMQWASRLFVLTNRRVIHFRGVLTVERTDIPLTRIGEADLLVTGVQPWLRLGSIRIRRLDDRPVAIVWDFVSRPQEVHAALTRAIRRAQSGEM